MGFIAKLLSFTRVTRNESKLSDSKVNPGGGANITGEHFTDPGDDSSPLPADSVAMLGIPREGGAVAVGYADTVNTPKAQPGDKRIYARDATTGAVVAEVWLKNTGEVEVSNGSGSFVLEAGGNIIINGTTFFPGGDVTSSGTITGDEVQTDSGIDLKTHVHGGVTSGGSLTGAAQ